MKEKIYQAFGTILVVAMGFIIGSTLNSNSASAMGSCDNTGCHDDQISGWRCFGGVEGYTCDDSGYPDCYEVSCTS